MSVMARLTAAFCWVPMAESAPERSVRSPIVTVPVSPPEPPLTVDVTVEVTVDPPPTVDVTVVVLADPDAVNA